MTFGRPLFHRWVIGVSLVASGAIVTLGIVQSAAARAADGKPAAVAMPASASQPVDLYGDPIPVGAAVRLGTVRFRTSGSVRGMAFVGESSTLVTLEGEKLRFWQARSGKLLREIALPKQPYRTLAISPDGQVAAVGGQRFDAELSDILHSVTFFDLETGKERSRIEWTPAHGGGCQDCRFTPDGKNIVILHDHSRDLPPPDLAITVWDIEKGELLAKTSFAGRYNGRIDVSPDGQQIAAVSYNAVIWTWRSDQPPVKLRQAPWQSEGVRFSPDGKLLAIGNAGSWGNAWLWDLKARKMIHALQRGKVSQSEGLVFTPDGKFVVVPSDRLEKAVLVWNVETGEIARRIDSTPFEARTLAISRDGHWLAACEWEARAARVKMWNLPSGEEMARDAVGHDQMLRNVVFSPDGKTVVTASYDGMIRTWNTNTGRPQLALRLDSGWPEIAVSTNGKWIASNALDSTRIEKQADGKLHLSDNADGVRLWEAASGKEAYRLPGHGYSGGRRPVAFAPDSRTFVTWGKDDAKLRVWDVATGKMIRQCEIRPSDFAPDDVDRAKRPPDPMRDWRFMLRWARFSADGKFLVLQHFQKVYVFDVDRGKEVQQISVKSQLRPMAVSPDGKRLALIVATGKPRQVRLASGGIWFEASQHFILTAVDSLSGKEIWRQPLRDEFDGQLAFSSDGKELAVAMRPPNNRIEFLDAASGRALHAIAPVPDVLAGGQDTLAFSPDGKRLACGMADTSVLIWNLLPEVP